MADDAVELFYSYAHEDETLRDQLEKHLSLLKQQGIISAWHKQEIMAGDVPADEIRKHLGRAGIILLLVSPSFMASEYCYGVEMQEAMKRHVAGDARVIPVILRPVDWKGAPFGTLSPLPKNAKPVTTWPNRDSAFADVVAGIRSVVEPPKQASTPPPNKSKRAQSGEDGANKHMLSAPTLTLQETLNVSPYTPIPKTAPTAAKTSPIGRSHNSRPNIAPPSRNGTSSIMSTLCCIIHSTVSVMPRTSSGTCHISPCCTRVRRSRAVCALVGSLWTCTSTMSRR